MKRYLMTVFTMIIAFAMLVTTAGATTDHTITLDGSNDFASDENLGSEAGRTGYLTWDASSLYIGITGNPIIGTNSNLYVVVDNTAVSGADPRSGAGRSDQPTGESGGATYPFNADVVFLFYGTGSEDGSVQNPAPGLKYTVSGGSWTDASIPSGVRIIRKSSTITELEIPFSELAISSDADFNILFYVANTAGGGNNFAQWPTGNADGNNPILKDFYTYTRKSGISPNAGQHYSYREHSTSGYSIGGSIFGSIFFVPASATTFNAGSLTTLGYHLYIGPNATFSMGSNTVALTVGKNVTIDGTLALSTASGGDLVVGGNWTNNGTFNANNRQVKFNGSGTQTVTGATTFDYLDIANTAGGNVALASNITVKKELKISSGGTLNAGSTTITLQGDSSAAPPFINNGTFNAGTGTMAFTGTNNKNSRVIGSSATTFNDVTMTSSDPGASDKRFGVDFYDHDTSKRATIAGTLTLNQYTFVATEENGNSTACGTGTCDGTPIYASTSTLRYNNSGSFDSAAEWWIDDGSPVCGSEKGLPYNIVIANSTTVNINAGFGNNGKTPNYGSSSNKIACGNITIESGSALQSTGGMLKVKGNWTNNNGASGFTHNNGTVRFNANSGSQTLVGNTTFCNVERVDASGSTFDWGNSTTTTIAGSFTVESGTQNAGTNTTVIFTGACGTAPQEIGGGTGAKRFVNITLAGGSLKHSGSGNINVTGNWTNNGATFDGTTRTVVLNGSAAQTIGGTTSTTFNNLTINNTSPDSAGVTLGIGQQVNGTLTLTSGRLTLGSNNLTLGPSAPAIAGSPFSASKMIVADGAGALCKRYNTIGSYDFPIGDVSGPSSTADYSPATLNFTAGTFGTDAQACVRVVDAAHPNGDQTNYPTYITRYWPVTQSNISGFTCTATFVYVDDDEVIGSGQSTAALYHWSYNSGTWTLHNQANAGTNTLSSPVTSFSDHTARSGSPLAVALAAFTADATPAGVTLTWETVSEADNTGFNVWRAAAVDGERTWLAFVPSSNPGSTDGAGYTYLDRDVVAGQTYWYWLEDVDLRGATTLHGPVSAIYAGPTAVELSGLAAGAAAAAGVPLAAALLALLLPLAGAAWARRRRA